MARYKRTPSSWDSDSTQYQALSDKSVEGNKDLHPAASITYEHEGEEPHDQQGQEETGQLFDHYPGEIDDVFSDPSMRAYIPTLLGLATQHHQRLTGRSDSLPRAAYSLSVQSAGMIAHLQQRGITVPTHPDNPDAQVNNDFTHDPFALLESDKGSLIDAATVKSGRDLVHGMLRKSAVSPKQFPSTGEQGKLF